MNKEEIENLKGNLEYIAEYEVDIVGEEHIKEALKYIDELEQKESILDKVTDKLKEVRRELDDDGFGYYAQEITNILNIMEGEKNERKD